MNMRVWNIIITFISITSSSFSKSLYPVPGCVGFQAWEHRVSGGYAVWDASQTHIHTHTHSYGQFSTAILPTNMFLGSGWKSGHVKRMNRQ